MNWIILVEEKTKKERLSTIYRILIRFGTLKSGLYWIRTSDPYPVKVML